MVSLYLTTALSEEMVLQEGTYTVSDTGTPGTYAPGEQIEFMDSMLAMGTYCEERNASNESVYGFITSGTVTRRSAPTTASYSTLRPTKAARSAALTKAPWR